MTIENKTKTFTNQKTKKNENDCNVSEGSKLKLEN